MGEDLKIRAATGADAATLAGMRVALAEEHELSSEAEGAYFARCHAFFESAVPAGAVLAWLAFCGADAVGAASLELRATFPRAHSLRDPAVDGRVRSVYVVPAYRRRGIATALMLALIEAAESERVDRLTLGASESGFGLYASLGFVLREREMIHVRAPRATV